jgi:hypothetical protein
MFSYSLCADERQSSIAWYGFDGLSRLLFKYSFFDTTRKVLEASEKDIQRDEGPGTFFAMLKIKFRKDSSVY